MSTIDAMRANGRLVLFDLDATLFDQRHSLASGIATVQAEIRTPCTIRSAASNTKLQYSYGTCI